MEHIMTESEYKEYINELLEQAKELGIYVYWISYPSYLKRKIAELTDQDLIKYWTNVLKTLELNIKKVKL